MRDLFIIKQIYVTPLRSRGNLECLIKGQNLIILIVFVTLNRKSKAGQDKVSIMLELCYCSLSDRPSARLR